MSDEKDFGFEETKSAIFDYYVLFKEVQGTLIWIIVGSVFSFLLFKETFFHLLEYFRDNGLVFTGAESPFVFVNHLNGAFIHSMIGFMLVPCVVVPIAWLFYTTIIKGRKLQKNLINFQSNLIKRSYLTNFELVEPEIIIQGGDPKLEKFVNHLSLVFTDINKKNKKRLKKGKPAEQFWTWKRRRISAYKDYFFMINTVAGSYVAQSYENKVTVDDVKTVIKKIHFEKNVFLNPFGTNTSYRIIILGKEFDSSFDDENIIQTMNELKRKFKIDIILETEYGYSTVWID